MLSKNLPDLPPEVVRQHGADELEQLRARMVLWKEDYIRHAPAGGGEEYMYLSREFVFEIEEYLYPYVRRLIETKHIDLQQATEFMDFCYRQVLEFIEHLGIEAEVPY